MSPRRLGALLALGVVSLTGPAAGAGGPAPLVRPPPAGAYFTERSYAPGDLATLIVRARSERARVQLFRIGAGGRLMAGVGGLVGEPVADGHDVSLARDREGGRQARIPIGRWESGLYFLRVAVDGRTRYAPFVLRPGALGAHRVAVVLPTNTWQAYNTLDEDGDGIGDSWYASSDRDTVSLERPYLGQGIPRFFTGYDLGFLRYLYRTGRSVDMLADDDLARFASGAHLARLYDVIVFPGHEEYVTRHAYDVVGSYRDAGGSLMFLSANNFFCRVTIRDGSMRRVGRWRDLGRPEAALVGVQYRDWDQESRLAPLVVHGAQRAPWLFAGTGVANGSRFGHFGIEIDGRTKKSPAATITVARLPHAFGRRLAAEMTYYETSAGAKVFAAGVMNFGGSASNPVVAKMLDNLWARLAPRGR